MYCLQLPFPLFQQCVPVLNGQGTQTNVLREQFLTLFLSNFLFSNWTFSEAFCISWHEVFSICDAYAVSVLNPVVLPVFSLFLLAP